MDKYVMYAYERTLRETLNKINFALMSGQVEGAAAESLEDAQREIIAILA